MQSDAMQLVYTWFFLVQAKSECAKDVIIVTVYLFCCIRIDQMYNIFKIIKIQ